MFLLVSLPIKLSLNIDVSITCCTIHQNFMMMLTLLCLHRNLIVLEIIHAQVVHKTLNLDWSRLSDPLYLMYEKRFIKLLYI